MSGRTVHVAFVLICLGIRCTESQGTLNDAASLERAYARLSSDMRLGRCTPLLDALIHCSQRPDYLGADDNREGNNVDVTVPGEPDADEVLPTQDIGLRALSNDVELSYEDMDSRSVPIDGRTDKRHNWDNLKKYFSLMGYGKRKPANNYHCLFPPFLRRLVSSRRQKGVILIQGPPGTIPFWEGQSTRPSWYHDDPWLCF